ncbi:MAG: Pyrimidine 5'-nucleotidase YjjG [candidate division WS6 bacterium OLB20]|uniref:Pyrimidine 5'-nucleotidase YjjG n=1 Tax=candidate division WS6 bacterium OLB20 TaxID=1617426 RepID=A0A136LWE2_9BACT|nr:MAG: Pyrimidine 5'-nucleotidase YjjG [candidate division WS6 bacterium OLB20]
MIRNILFDLDETLYNDQDVKAQADVDVLSYFSDNIDGISLTEHYQLYKDSDKELVFDWFINFLSNFTNKDSEIKEHAENAESIYWKSLSNIKLYPDALVFLNAVSGKFELGILSDGSRNKQLKKLDFLGLESFFNSENLVFSEDVGEKKPSKLMFDKIIEKMNLNPAETLYIGDRVDRDIVGGNQAGFVTVLLRRNRSFNVSIINEEEKPTYEITNFFDLLRIIE